MTRWLQLALGGLAAVLVGVVLFGNLNGSLVYYLTPTEAVEQRADFADGRRFRLAGQVVVGTVVEEGADTLRFGLADSERTVDIRFEGRPQELFRPGIDVVLEGAWSGSAFHADTMLIKHDETYRPPGGDMVDAAGSR